MSVLDREALEQSPLADLHAIASELSIDDYRLLRREQLVGAILARQEGAEGPRVGPARESPGIRTEPEPDEAEAHPRRRRSRRGGGSRAGSKEAIEVPAATEKEPAEVPVATEKQPADIPAATEEKPAEAPVATEEKLAEVPAATEKEPDEVAVTAASDRTRFEALAARFPDEAFRFESSDPVLSAIESLTPIGKGSRVTIAGPARAGKTEVLRRLTQALAGRDDLQLILTLVGVRPEEIPEWEAGTVQPLDALSLAAPPSAQDRAIYGAIDRARSIAVAGDHAVVLLDTLDGVHEHAARRALATARRLVDGGSVTVIATASEPLGGETTVIRLDPLGTETERAPALDLLFSGTLRAELLVGEQGAAAIAQARAEAVSQLQ